MSLHRKLRIHQIFGGGTGIGKTIISTALSKASSRLGEQTSYLKPIGTGADSDDKHVSKFTGSEVSTKCLYTFSDPVSPHLAAERMRKQAAHAGSLPVTPTDHELITSIYDHVNLTARSLGENRIGSLYIETAGGVHSPTLAGNSQLEAFRPLRLPTILIGSPLLGGISSTVSAYESLRIHGFDIDLLLVLKEEYYENYRYLERWAQERALDFAAVESPPELINNDSRKEFDQMNAFYHRITHPTSSVSNAVRILQARHLHRVEQLESMPERALKQIWWPFLQHNSLVSPSQVTVIDSAYKDHMLTYQADRQLSAPSISTNENQKESNGVNSLVQQKFDGSASWWTQSLGHANSQITLSAAHAAGRFGHVIFPSCVHEPALNLTEHMLKTVGAGWANRVFFSDNGSTGVEVALKMGLTSYRRRHKLPSGVHFDLGVIGLKGSYHGDTIGAMDASEHSVYNAQVDWYKGKGLWLDAPQVHLVDSHQALILTNPGDQWGPTGWKVPYPSLQTIYDLDKRLKEDPLTEVYTNHIYTFLRKSRYESSIIPASLIIEPVIMGAGGMIFVDPLFQNVLINVVRNNPQLFGHYKGAIAWSANPDPPVNSNEDDSWRGLPVIFDEVFSGLYRLGKPSAAALLGRDIHPDIAVYSKMLSAGTVPLSVTLAREDIFDGFRGDGAVSALLHGHSYTAHPIGCSVAHTGLKIYEAMDANGSWDSAKQSWQAGHDPSTETAIWSLWSHSFIQQLTKSDEVDGAMTLGTVLAIYLKDQTNSKGYTSSAAKNFLSRLQSSQLNKDQQIPFGLHARPLGNVAYFIASLNTSSETLHAIQEAILCSLNLASDKA
ncbi:uncharacterized protein PGTG_14186 [Puccinia graminis f. sp. tritici CRL 75-36-700-3]|uniref:Dethiobiotin synthase n=1 Tax=Puccinia graminis f. sp. tritici (strain CRL 75-36-700-3 / race SCCL) TaxID=418459 RepID=E3KX77_PUCGT|nr:uncharacterized protein PGTG_14186 [Puccinia graminis f. sp. tritici CRL 75-36-700-3]EFP88847.2 hypothetical protein PGTG_14186 [Puccinia graminis f. sp. tritici CRL 75-36-700-3]